MKKLLFVELFIIYPVLLYSQTLTWEDVLTLTQAKNPALIKARESIKQSQINYNLSLSNFLPTFSASAISSRSGHDKPSFTTDDNYSYGLNGQILLNNTYSDINQVKIKDIDREIEEMRYKRTIADIIYNIRKSYINLLVTQEMFELTGQIIERRIKNFELVQLKYDAGREDRGSLLRVDADKLQAQYDYDSAKRNLQTASLQLARDIGIDSYDVIKVTGTLNVIFSSGDILKDTGIANIPEYTIAKYNMDKSEINIKTAKSNLYPDLSFTGSISKSWSKSVQDDSIWSTGLNLSYPLYNAGRNTNNIKLAESNKTVSEKNLQELELQLKTSIKAAQINFINAVENLEIRKKFLIAAEEQSKIITMKYINGLATYYEWYYVENDIINYQKILLTAKKDVIISESTLKNILGLSPLEIGE